MSTIKTTTLSTQGGSTVPVDTVVNGTAKAWVNFNGTGTVAIRRAFNVSSITDGGTGNYTVNFTTAMVDANYSVSVLAVEAYGAGTDSIVVAGARRRLVLSTTSVGVCGYVISGGALYDAVEVCVSIFS
jgi:hypothetical protein